MSAEQQIAAMLLSENSEGADLEMLRDAANNIFYQYLSEKVRRSGHGVSSQVFAEIAVFRHQLLVNVTRRLCGKCYYSLCVSDVCACALVFSRRRRRG